MRAARRLPQLPIWDRAAASTWPQRPRRATRASGTLADSPGSLARRSRHSPSSCVRLASPSDGRNLLERVVDGERVRLLDGRELFERLDEPRDHGLTRERDDAVVDP